MSPWSRPGDGRTRPTPMGCVSLATGLLRGAPHAPRFASGSTASETRIRLLPDLTNKGLDAFIGQPASTRARSRDRRGRRATSPTRAMYGACGRTVMRLDPPARLWIW